MMLRRFLIVSVLSLTASAFLVVPSFSTSVEDAALDEIPDLHFLDKVQAQNRDFLLTCSECPFPERTEDGLVNWVEGIETTLELNVATRNNMLYINDHQVFPPSDSRPLFTVEQHRTSDGQSSGPVGMALFIEVLPLMPPQDGNALFSIRFTIPEIEGRPVSVDMVTLTTVRMSTGELFIARTEVEAITATDGQKSLKQCGCNPRCLKELLFARIQALWSAAAARLTNFTSRIRIGQGCRKGAFEASMPDHHKTGGYHHHIHHGHHHGWRHTFISAVRFIVIPALLGVMAGLVASVIGMLVGQLIVFVWIRHRRSTYTARRQVSSTIERGTGAEKESFLHSEFTDDLPPYSDEDAANAPSMVESK